MHELQYYKTETGVGGVFQFVRACLSCMRYDTQHWLGQVVGSQVISAHRRCRQASHNVSHPSHLVISRAAWARSFLREAIHKCPMFVATLCFPS